jgi:hypothetical protein
MTLTRIKAIALVVLFAAIFSFFLAIWYPLLTYLATLTPTPTSFAVFSVFVILFATIIALAYVGGIGIFVFLWFDRHFVSFMREGLNVSPDRLGGREYFSGLVTSWILTTFYLTLLYILPTEASVSGFLPTTFSGLLSSATAITTLIQPGMPLAAFSQILLGMSGAFTVILLRWLSVFSKDKAPNKTFPRLTAYLAYLSAVAIIIYVATQPHTYNFGIIEGTIFLSVMLFTTFGFLTLVPLERGLKRIFLREPAQTT